ncbi:MAG: isopentenyl-diphosphate delta-isomerase, partial [Crocinitomicaceae bacterium]
MESVVLVNQQDEVLGSMEKMEAHYSGSLHRAFSVFIFNDQKELLLQQRAHSKYHSGGLWTNSCCSHPRIEETTLDAGIRRLNEELGFTTELNEEFSFIYRAELDQDMIEHEL